MEPNPEDDTHYTVRLTAPLLLSFAYKGFSVALNDAIDFKATELLGFLYSNRAMISTDPERIGAGGERSSQDQRVLLNTIRHKRDTLWKEIVSKNPELLHPPEDSSAWALYVKASLRFKREKIQEDIVDQLLLDYARKTMPSAHRQMENLLREYHRREDLHGSRAR